jgi:hypothetical protein
VKASDKHSVKLSSSKTPVLLTSITKKDIDKGEIIRTYNDYYWVRHAAQEYQNRMGYEWWHRELGADKAAQCEEIIIEWDTNGGTGS